MKKYRSSISRSVHESMEDMYKIGLLSVAEMHEFDVDCLIVII